LYNDEHYQKMELKIRQENRGDIKEVYEINSFAFGRENEAKIVNLLRDSDTFVPDDKIVKFQQKKGLFDKKSPLFISVERNLGHVI